MKQTLILVVIFVTIVTICCAQNKTETTPLPTTLKEYEEVMKKAFDERDKQLSKPQILYYSPVVNPLGSQIAYIKRTLDYNLKGGGTVPFLSDSPKVNLKSEVVELCKSDVVTGVETVLERWVMPKTDDQNTLSYITVGLEWSKSGLFYEINFSSYDKKIIEGGYWCKGSGFCLSNKKREPILQGPSVVNGIKVSLDKDPAKFRFPTSNKIILDCDSSKKTCSNF